MSLFEKQLDKDDIDLYVKFLRDNGFVVIEPKRLDATSVKSAGALVDYFYALLQYCNQNRKIHYAKATDVDRKKANLFIKARMETVPCSRQKAIRECTAIVKCVVENESEFSLSEPIHSFDCFGQERMKWVTDKAISIINNENAKIKNVDLVLFMDTLAEKQEEEALETFYDNIDELKGILGGLQDGEDEKEEG